ncbi:hypothetical protein F5148DRAFT_983135 [Russula earlei]|uniref:Uncharacterized protein n=1 Tax=Russula earlei TaxID=71964 RepID=A0ACC0U543_9AGAM|nr:hypothetical protein F5148DRAFT_983135 [Russula earlei]
MSVSDWGLPHFIFISRQVSRASPIQKESLVKAWMRAITTLPSNLQSHFTVLEGTLSSLPPDLLRCDCVVSPANAFGIMEGGYDHALSLAFQGVDGPQTLSRHVQRALRARWHGYLPPGSCLITTLPESDGNPFGASSIAILPTMRYPVDVRWHRDLVYNAVWNLLVEINRWNSELVAHGTENSYGKTIERVLMTGLGTGHGQMSAVRCAQQMILAIKHFSEGVPEDAGWEKVDSWIKEVNATLEL